MDDGDINNLDMEMDLEAGMIAERGRGSEENNDDGEEDSFVGPPRI